MMKIFKVIADKRPSECLLCPLKCSTVKNDFGECGKLVKKNICGGWEEKKRVPDERCVFEVR